MTADRCLDAKPGNDDDGQHIGRDHSIEAARTACDAVDA